MAAAEPTYRVGFIGVGGMGIANYHAGEYRRHPRVDIVSCCDIVDEATTAFSERFDVPERYTDYEAGLVVGVSLGNIKTLGKRRGRFVNDVTARHDIDARMASVLACVVVRDAHAADADKPNSICRLCRCHRDALP